VFDVHGHKVGAFHDDAIDAQPFSGPVFPDENEPKSIHCVHVVSSEVMAEIQNPLNDNAWFVLPSQFNGVEYPSYRSIVRRVDEYTFDKTAGPRGQLAVHPAVGQFLLDNASNDDRPDGFNALDHLLPKLEKLMDGKYKVFFRNGYLGLPECSMPLQDDFFLSLGSVMNSLRCLHMQDVPASGLKPSFGERSSAQHRVNLVYASAVPVQSYLNRVRADQEPFQQEVSRLLMAAQYYGALCHASKKAPRPSKVYLLPLGLGAFKNNPVAVASAISCAIERFAGCLPEDVSIDQLLDIRLLMYQRNPAEAAEMTSLLKRMQKLAK